VAWGDGPALAIGVDRWLPKEEAGLRAACWEAHVSAVFHLRGRERVLRPYLGAGMSFIRTTGEATLVTWDVSATQWSRGANVLAGFDLRLARRYDAYAEARGQIWGKRQVVVGAGVRINLIR
jgi:hypothetical protein